MSRGEFGLNKARHRQGSQVSRLAPNAVARAAEIAAAFPPLTDEQRDQITALLCAGRYGIDPAPTRQLKGVA
jgi:hypothetical protein